MFPSKNGHSWKMTSRRVSVSPRFDFATKKGGNETDAKLADPIAGAESRSCGLPGSDFIRFLPCQLSESSMVIYELNKMWCVMLMDLKRYFWNLMNIMFFFTRWTHMEKSEHQICEDKHLTTSNMVLSENGVYPNMASVGKMVNPINYQLSNPNIINYHWYIPL